MADYKKQLTFGEFYARKKYDYVLNRMESREEFKTIKAYDLFKKIIKAPLLIIKKTDDFNTSMADTSSDKIVAMATACFYVFVFYIGYKSLAFCSQIIQVFKTCIGMIYYSNNTGLLVILAFITLFVSWFIINRVINKLYKERSMKRILTQKFNEDYDNKVANDDMINAFFYYYYADVYKNALQKAYSVNGNKIYHKDLLNINDYI